MAAAESDCGDLVTDAHIAALAGEHRAERSTSNDGDFARFPGLRGHNLEIILLEYP